jgi:hypothetical protein
MFGRKVVGTYDVCDADEVSVVVVVDLVLVGQYHGSQSLSPRYLGVP